MPLQYPLRVHGDPKFKFVCIFDSSDRPIAGGLLREDAEEIVEALNAHQPPSRCPVCAGPMTKDDPHAACLEDVILLAMQETYGAG